MVWLWLSRDRVWKYGASARIFPTGKKEHWIEFAYQNNYRNTGNVNIHPEIDRRGLQNWLLVQVDKIEEYKATAHGRFGYWELDLAVVNNKNCNHNIFIASMKRALRQENMM